MRILTLTAAILLGTAISAAAQCRTVNQRYYAQPYTQPYVQQYAQNYVQQYEVIKPVAVATFIVPNQFYSVAPELADARVKQQIADDAADHAIQRLMLMLQQQQQGNQSNQGSSNPPPLAGTGSPGLASPRDHPSSLNTKVQAMASQQCVNCHHGTGSKDGGRLDLRDVTRLGEVQVLKMIARTTLNPDDPGFMPQGGKFIGEQAYADLAHWSYEIEAKGGAPTTIPKANIDPKATPKATLPTVPSAPPVPPLPPAPMGKVKDKAGDKGDDDGLLSMLDPDNQLDKKKKKPKPRPKPIG